MQCKRLCNGVRTAKELEGVVSVEQPSTGNCTFHADGTTGIGVGRRAHKVG